MGNLTCLCRLAPVQNTPRAACSIMGGRARAEADLDFPCLRCAPARQGARHREDGFSRGTWRLAPAFALNMGLCYMHLCSIYVKNFSPGTKEQVPSRGHGASPQSGLGVSCKRPPSSKKKLRGLSARALPASNAHQMQDHYLLSTHTRAPPARGLPGDILSGRAFDRAAAIRLGSLGLP